MDFVFADDARQKNASRKRTGSLISIGGLYVPDETVCQLERALEALCAKVGFPTGEQFKWSPGKKETFMKTKLLNEERLMFLKEALAIAKEHAASAIVVVEDISRKPASRITHEEDVTALFLERADWIFRTKRKDGFVIVATPGGGESNKDKFATNCLELRATGTSFSKLQRIPLGVVTVPSRQMRLLQLADIITSCTVARISGESNYSPRIFEIIKTMFHSESGRIGGVGLKLHPDLVFVNLYYWLLGDSHYIRGNVGHPLPIQNRPFAENSGEAV